MQQCTVPNSQAYVRRNLETAREAVAAAQADGTRPKLSSLLVEQSWLPHMRPEFDKQYFRQLQRFLETEWQAQKVFPPPEMIFRSAGGRSQCSLEWRNSASASVEAEAEQLGICLMIVQQHVKGPHAR